MRVSTVPHCRENCPRRIKKILGPFAQMTLILAVASSVNAAELQKLTASDGAAHDSFGRSVAIAGETVLIGALADDDNGLTSGSAYLFKDTSGAGDWSLVSSRPESDLFRPLSSSPWTGSLRSSLTFLTLGGGHARVRASAPLFHSGRRATMRTRSEQKGIREAIRAG